MFPPAQSEMPTFVSFAEYERLRSVVRQRERLASRAVNALRHYLSHPEDIELGYEARDVIRDYDESGLA